MILAISNPFPSASSLIPQTTLTNPFSSASCAEKYRPVNANSRVHDSFPTSLGNRCNVPKSAANPISTSLMLNFTSFVAIRISQADEMSIAIPNENP